MMAAMRSPTPSEITSRTNPRVAAVAALRDRRERDREGLTIVDGAREVRRAIESGAELVEAFTCGPLLAGPDARAALDALERRGTPVHRGQRGRLREARVRRPGGGAARRRQDPRPLAGRLALPPDPLVAVIEGVEKPGNIGAVLRSADGAGADALVAASPRTDLFNPNAIRASAGTIFRVPLAAAPDRGGRSPGCAQRGLRIVATRVDAERPYTDVDLTGPIAIVLGAEADGLTATWDAPDIEAVRIPMRGIADSLNVSVAAALLLFEARRQRDRHADRAD